MFSLAACYVWVKHMDQPDPDADRMALVQEAQDASYQTYGYRRVKI